jgi:ABC-type nitrate/sulfonate/bicarbonate transport system substrate-binding protein
VARTITRLAHSPSPVPPRLRLGWVALNDAAPLIVARELGHFHRQGVAVELSREIGWASVRDKIAYGELQAAHAPAGLLVSTRLGLGCPPVDCLTACVLNVHGNAITLSERLWQSGVRDAITLRDHLVARRHERALVFGTVFTHSGHYLHLVEWLRQGGINPARDVRLVVVPPAQVFRNLVAGTIDGYCVGEPWNSLAVAEGAGWCPVLSRDLHPEHPEKVLLVRSDFARHHHDKHLAVIAALLEAATLCDDPAFRPELVRLLARREYLNLAPEVVQAGLLGPFHLGHGAQTDVAGVVRFSGPGVNDPRPERVEWFLEGFRQGGLLPPTTFIPPGFARELFRTDLFHQACQRHLAPTV